MPGGMWSSLWESMPRAVESQVRRLGSSAVGSGCSFGGIGRMSGIRIMLAGRLAGGIGYILAFPIQPAGPLSDTLLASVVNASRFLNDDQRAESI